MYQFLICLIFFFAPVFLQAGYQKVNGRWIESKYIPYLSIEKHLELGQNALEHKLYPQAVKHFEIVSHSDADRSLVLSAVFGQANAFFYMDDYEESDALFDRYLRESERNRFFETIMSMKFEIAEKFRLGAKRRPFGYSSFPRILSGKDIAIKIYDEIVVGLPRSDLAARAFLAKAQLYRDQREYVLSTQALQQVIADFGKHPLCLQAFEDQAQSYLLEMKTSSRNEELLELARLNIQKLKTRFPGADLSAVETCFTGMKELYAQSLCDAALLYKHKGHKEAYELYKHRLLKLYPDTNAAQILKKSQAS
jgi:outer membrane protein assembly factor BamD (BamD/ComL family)